MFDGLAIDVGRQKLYYADADASVGKIGELSTDGTSHRFLLNVTGSQPRAIVLDVNSRFIFFHGSVLFRTGNAKKSKRVATLKQNTNAIVHCTL